MSTNASEMHQEKSARNIHEDLESQPEQNGGIQMSVEELRQFDGVCKVKIYLAVNGTVYDVTSGREHYGPG